MLADTEESNVIKTAIDIHNWRACTDIIDKNDLELDSNKSGILMIKLWTKLHILYFPAYYERKQDKDALTALGSYVKI